MQEISHIRLPTARGIFIAWHFQLAQLFSLSFTDVQRVVHGAHPTSMGFRDHLGGNLVPYYLTSVKEGGFYGWPYAYWGQHEEPEMKERQQPDRVKQTIVLPYITGCSHSLSRTGL